MKTFTEWLHKRDPEFYEEGWAKNLALGGALLGAGMGLGKYMGGDAPGNPGMNRPAATAQDTREAWVEDGVVYVKGYGDDIRDATIDAKTKLFKIAKKQGRSSLSGILMHSKEANEDGVTVTIKWSSKMHNAARQVGRQMGNTYNDDGIGSSSATSDDASDFLGGNSTFRKSRSDF